MFVPSIAHMIGIRITRPNVIRPDVPQAEKPKPESQNQPQQPKRKRHA